MSRAQPALDAPALPTFLRYVGASTLGLLALTSAAVVDGLMVGKWLGADALAAVNLLIPLWILLFGSVLMLAIGASVVAGHYLGAGRRDAASGVFSASVCLALVFGLTVTVLGLTFGDGLLRWLAVPEPLQPLVKPYFQLLLLGQAPQSVAVVLYYFLRVAGEPQRASRALVLGALVNILLDVLGLAVLGWGLRAAAGATVAAQLTQCLVLLHLLYSGRTSLRLRPGWLSWRRLIAFCGNGFSEFLNEVSAGVVLFVLHWLLALTGGVAAVSGFALIHYALLLNVMLACAVAEVVHVLTSQNLGAGQPVRARRFRDYGLGLAATQGLLLWTLVFLGGPALSDWFFEGSAADYAARFWPVIAPVFLLTGLNLVLSAWCTGCRQPRRSALLALARSLVLPLVFLALLFPWRDQVSFLWALPLAELLTLGLALGMLADKASIRRLLPLRQ
ncbi:putative MATE family efflux protein [Marinimicrobium koreense]|uniref:Putative MATE family efflux protein n=1 Tax=Marinimicrobium koreense TaxID=306545 RepID=A0A3N1NUF4_9GAMM|nr:MATE family efflux transporter [Marinimicrobium koreense]ROQ18587.1 putative MATE family efflux protein [Marinimicrobium koreense]